MTILLLMRLTTTPATSVASIDSRPTTDADAIETVLAEILGSDSINPEVDRLRQSNESLASENSPTQTGQRSTCERTSISHLMNR